MHPQPAATFSEFHSQAYFGDDLGISWGYLEQILGMSSAYLGHILDIIGHILDIFGGYLGDILEISWGYLMLMLMMYTPWPTF